MTDGTSNGPNYVQLETMQDVCLSDQMTKSVEMIAEHTWKDLSRHLFQLKLNKMDVTCHLGLEKSYLLLMPGSSKGQLY